MKENFVTYEQSLALKELGFKEPCFGCFTKSGELSYDFSDNKDEGHYFQDCAAPLKSQVFKWFRKNSSINGIVLYYGKDQWNIEILDYKGNELIQIEDNTFWSYEEAESACIDKLIELIKDLSK
jgi:hypothetical protein